MLQHQVFTEEFKRDAVRLAKECGNTAAVVRDLGRNESFLSNGMRAFYFAASHCWNCAS